MKKAKKKDKRVKLVPVRGDTPSPTRNPEQDEPRRIASHSRLAAFSTRPAVTPYVIPQPFPGVVPKGARTMAQDDAIGAAYQFAVGNYGTNLQNEGLIWPGYAYLAELSQRSEYRKITETLAREMTRKWIKIQASGDEDKSDVIAKLEAAFDKFKIRDLFRNMAEHDGFFGRGQIYIDTGSTNSPEELATPLMLSPNKLPKGGLKALRVVSAMWTYPTQYNSFDPLQANYYHPVAWFVMGKQVHTSRLLTFVGRELPDILRPAYNFCGLSMSQMARPYVDNWLRTRQSVSDLLHSFSVSGIKTNMQAAIGGFAGDEMLARAQLFNMTRDNRGLFMLDKETEEFFNISTPLGTVDHLQAQSQEQMASVSGIPLVKLLGITPSGLNACLPGDTLIETDRGQVAIRDVHVNDKVMTRKGLAPLAWAGITKYSTDFVEIKTSHSSLRCTPNHRIYLPTIDEFVPAENVWTDDLLLCHGISKTAPVWDMTLHVAIQSAAAIAQRAILSVAEHMCSVARHLTQTTSTSAVDTLTPAPKIDVIESVRRILHPEEPVYDLQVARGHLPEFFANGILVHNSSDGEIRSFYDFVLSYQEHLFGSHLETVLKILQLHEFGKIDDEIGYRFLPLWELNETERASVRKTDVDTAVELINAGVLHPEEERKRLATTEDSLYHGLDIDDVPEPPEDPSDPSLLPNPARSEHESEI